MITDENLLPWDIQAPFSKRFTVRSEDIDELRHTNNTVYVKWCESTAWAHSNALGMNIAKFRDLDRAMAIRHSEYAYELATSLEELGAAARSFRILADYLERHPEALVHGKAKTGR